jgi:glycerate 2-kinase
MSSVERSFLRGLYAAALDAVDPLRVVPAFLPKPGKGRTVVIGAGKAAARMALAVESNWPGSLEGMVVTRYGHGAPCQRIKVIEAAHPVPDQAGASAAARILEIAASVGKDDLVICLLSGGGSALLSLPALGLSFEDKRRVNCALLASGAAIDEMNCVRRHLSRIKGGKLAAACGAARLVSLIISDVPRDDPATVASGPTIADQSTPADALGILKRYGIAVPPSVHAVLTARATHSPAQTPAGPREHYVIATAQHALNAAAAKARERGVTPLVLGGSIEGEAREVARCLAGIARQMREHGQPQAAPCVMLSGGETTVTMRGDGQGGRNAEFLLALALATRDITGLHALACDTDGIDGIADNAGALLAPDSLARAAAVGLDARAYLMRNDAYGFFAALNDLVVTGPTRTNVNDFRAILLT